MAINKTTLIVSALATCGFCVAIYGSFYGRAASRSHSHIALSDDTAARNEQAKNPDPLVHITRDTGSSSEKRPATRAVTSQPAEAQAWLDEQFPNKVYPEITHQVDLRKDNPAEYERQVRALNPDYAKVLDEDKLSDQAKERAQRELDQEAEQRRQANERAEREPSAAR